jgi:ribonuclease P protein component
VRAKLNSSQSFPAFLRVKRRSSFTWAKEKGQKVFSKHFLVIALKQPQGPTRLGITITTKVHRRAVQRNRLKRRIREVFRRAYTSLRPSFDLVVIARLGATDLDYRSVEKELIAGFNKLALVE